MVAIFAVILSMIVLRVDTHRKCHNLEKTRYREPEQ